jgi:hypothetical protein
MTASCALLAHGFVGNVASLLMQTDMYAHTMSFVLIFMERDYKVAVYLREVRPSNLV